MSRLGRVFDHSRGSGAGSAAQDIRVRYVSRSAASIETDYQGFVARVVQHEIDHLEGIVFLDRIESSRDIVMEKEWRKIVAQR